MEFTAREARLKPEFADRYPQVEAGVWVPAAELGAQVLLWQVQQQGTAALATRILDERHFEFRGGWYRGDSTELRTRAIRRSTVRYRDRERPGAEGARA